MLQNISRTGFCNCSFRSMMWLRSAALHEEVMTDSTINVWYSILVGKCIWKYVIFVLDVYMKMSKILFSNVISNHKRHLFTYIFLNYKLIEIDYRRLILQLKSLYQKLLSSSFDVLSGIGMKHNTFNSHIKFCCQ